jgi:hypothetical protein
MLQVLLKEEFEDTKEVILTSYDLFIVTAAMLDIILTIDDSD